MAAAYGAPNGIACIPLIDDSSTMLPGDPASTSRRATACVVTNDDCRLSVDDRGEPLGRHRRHRRPVGDRHPADHVHQPVQRRQAIEPAERPFDGGVVGDVGDHGHEPRRVVDPRAR